MLGRIIQITRNMGLRYVIFRAWYEFKKRTGILKLSFPTTFKRTQFITKSEWQHSASRFFFNDKTELEGFPLSQKGKEQLKKDAELILNGKLIYFGSLELPFGENDDPKWLKNEDTGYKYTLEHWVDIPDFDPERGDIKYVWEKSRFSWSYTLIRAEHHLGMDNAAFIFSKIDHWLQHNPPNQGPNYVCSQETSLRCLNWIFTLYYYKNHPELTEERFGNILHSIWIQAHHVEKNINFSRIAVRNNHAITETLFLYLIGLLFDFYPEAKRWKTKGKRYFEQEILYQIYEDGSYLQYSMNYQRVVIQLCTWGLFLAAKNQEKFDPKIEERILRCLNFLIEHQDPVSGELPNYGANDGALFFPLNGMDFRNYNGQLNALYWYFKKTSFKANQTENSDHLEDVFWFGESTATKQNEITRTSQSFDHGGFYVLRETEYFSTIRCGNHPNRPSQADNLHLDLWYSGKNIMRDGGSYKYNATEEEIHYFFGSESHNVVMVNDQSQMKKGPRFVWFHWSQAEDTKTKQNEVWQEFKGTISAFGQIVPDIRHTRIVKQHRTQPVWQIEDFIEGTELTCKQLWHPSPDFYEMGFTIECMDKSGKTIEPVREEGWYSGYYGIKQPARQITFTSDMQYFKTVIKRRN